MKITAEDREQMELVIWRDTHVDQWPELRYLFHVPNGGLRTKQAAIKFKLLGVVAGVPDFILLVPRRQFHGLVLEMKAISAKGRKGVLSPEQKAFLTFADSQGYLTAVAWTADDAKRILSTYLDSSNGRLVIKDG